MIISGRESGWVVMEELISDAGFRVEGVGVFFLHPVFPDYHPGCWVEGVCSFVVEGCQVGGWRIWVGG